MIICKNGEAKMDGTPAELAKDLTTIVIGLADGFEPSLLPGRNVNDTIKGIVDLALKSRGAITRTSVSYKKRKGKGK